MELTTPARKLKAIIQDGMLTDVILAREAYALLRAFGENSDALLTSTYAHLFDALDRALLCQYILAIARLYDRPSSQYEIRSIPAALECISQNVDAFPVLERYSLEQRLVAAGLDLLALKGCTDVQLMTATLTFFQSRIPSASPGASDDLSLALKAVRARRDKRLAHSEHTLAEVFPALTWKQAEELVRFAENFLGCVAFGYLRYAISDDDGRFILEGDASRPARAFTRLLKAAAITHHPE